VLKIDRTESAELGIEEDPTSYMEDECQELLWRIHEGNRLTGGLKFVTKCYGIVGKETQTKLLCSSNSFVAVQIITLSSLIFQAL
jgi:hypothetical protein